MGNEIYTISNERNVQPYDKSIEELKDGYEREETKVRELLLDPKNRLILLSYNTRIAPKLADGTFPDDLGKAIWERLKEETDIPEMWRTIDYNLFDTPCGVFVTNAKELNAILEVPVTDRDTTSEEDKKSRSSAYLPSKRTITLLREQILQDVLLSALHMSRGIDSSLSSLAHEQIHDANASLHKRRVIDSEIDHPTRNLKIDPVIAETIYQGQIYARASQIKVETDLESILNANGLFYFVQEVCSDLGDCDTGSVDFVTTTTDRIAHSSENAYADIKALTLQNEDFIDIEQRIRALNALGMSGSSLSFALKSAVISEYRDMKAHGSRDTLADFVNVDYLRDLLDDTIMAQLKSRGVDIQNVGTVVADLYNKQTYIQKYRFYEQKRIITEELLEYLEAQQTGQAILIDQWKDTKGPDDMSGQVYELQVDGLSPDQCVELIMFAGPGKLQLVFDLNTIMPNIESGTHPEDYLKPTQNPTDPELIEQVATEVANALAATPEIAQQVRILYTYLGKRQKQDPFAQMCFNKVTQLCQHT